MKSSRNIGRLDRRLRFWFSFVLLVIGLWYFNGASLNSTGLSISIFSGIIMLSALAAYCPVCHLFRIHTLSEEELNTYGSPYYSRKQLIKA
ncbi:MAG: DUF2892 domain-containing protein [Bacteroidetes bacterium]|nr:DUF2892 domain-containing protein [Bacteroidota bacterium]